MSAQEKMDLYHRLIEILKEVVNLQDPPLMKVRIGNQVKFVRAILQVALSWVIRRVMTTSVVARGDIQGRQRYKGCSLTPCR
jgi:hypothetical protein